MSKNCEATAICFQRLTIARLLVFSYSQIMSMADMTSRENEVLETAVSILRRELDPQRIILFGSRAEGHHDPGSDFDLAIDGPKPVDRAHQIHEAVNDSVGLYSVDIIYLPNVDPDFRNLVMKTGKVIYERKA